MDVRSENRGGGVIVVIGGVDLRGGGDVANEGLYSEAAGYHCRIYCRLTYL